MEQERTPGMWQMREIGATEITRAASLRLEAVSGCCAWAVTGAGNTLAAYIVHFLKLLAIIFDKCLC